MTISPRTPVIIGVAQVSHRPDNSPSDTGTADRSLPDAVDLMAQAVRAASVDTRAADAAVRNAIDTIAVVGGLWRHQNPGALIAGELSLTQPIRSILTTFGGNMPIKTTHELAAQIAAGELDVAVVAGGECNLTRRVLEKQGRKPRRREEPTGTDVERRGDVLDMGDRFANDRGGEIPRNSYAVLDSAIRASRGETLDEARDRAARLWAGYAAVAAGNPHAADRQGLDEGAIRNPSAGNRMVSWPYTKAMCANNTVDQAAAIILCSTEKADELGVPQDRRVHPSLCVNAEDTLTLLDRADVAATPGLVGAAAAVLDALGTADAIDHVDLYSCFPSIVTLTTEAFGLDPSRRLTVTGGLAFAGAPLNFAAGQGLVGMVDTLRADPGSVGLVQGNGGHATKHSIGIYSTSAPTTPHTIVDVETHDAPRPLADPDRAGEAAVKGITVEYDHDGPARAIAIVEFDDTSRMWAISTDPAVMELATRVETVGRRVSVEGGEIRLL
ncbi:MAG: hypothetical protein RIB98_00945 [Acidimicrobiales bacterium]